MPCALKIDSLQPTVFDLNSLKSRSLGLLGAGNMAEALARGVLNADVISTERIIVSDVSAERRDFFAVNLGIRTTADNVEVVKVSDLVVLCVKPQQIDELLKQIAHAIRPDVQVIASICAGISTARLEKLLPKGARVVRVMPNMSMLVGLGASGLCGGSQAQSSDIALVRALFSSASLTIQVEEKLMDAVTGLSGSGPAYLFYLVEAMMDAGVAEGFTKEQALALAARTVLGAARMLEETGLAPEELRRRVTSPNGTTQAAIERLDADGVKAKIIAAIQRSAERSRELSR
ncbi:MAG: pyrroline-5-carboxylate reductase [Planctomycetota bacterium]